MKLSYYEIKKLFRYRFIRICLLILLILNAVFVIKSTDYVSDSIPIRDIVSVFRMAEKDSAAVKSIYTELVEEQRKQDAWIDEQMRLGNYDAEIPQLPNRYVSSEEYTDLQLFNILYSEVDAIRSYPDMLDQVIGQARRNLREYESEGIHEGRYVWRMQVKNIEIYDSLKDTVRIGLEYPHGWDVYFSNQSPTICICIMLLLFSSVLYTEENNSGFMPLLRVSRMGRGQTALAKTSALMLTTVFLTLLFSLESFAVIGLRVGYSSPFNAIQSFKAFELCPYPISVGAYFLIHTGIRMLAFLLLGAVTVTVSVLTYQYAIVYLGGLGFLGISFLLNSIRYVKADHPLKILNFVSVASVNDLFKRYQTMNLFHRPADYVPLTVVLYGFAIIALLLLSVWKYTRGANQIRLRILPKIQKAFLRSKDRTASGSGVLHPHCLSVLGWEFYKLFVSSRAWAIILALLLVHGGLCRQEFAHEITFSDAVYRDYMTRYAGELTDETRNAIAEERVYINGILGQEEQMRLGYLNGAVSDEQYAAYLEDYRYAYGRSELFRDIESHVRYINELDNQEQEAWFVYDTGWKALFFSDFQWTLYVSVLLLFAGIFTSEYERQSSSGGFAQILRCARKGRGITWRCKYWTAVLSSALMAGIWNLMEFLFVRHFYALSLMNAPLASIEAFHGCSFGGTIMQYLLIFWGVRLLATILFTVSVCSLSAILKKLISVLSSAAILTLLPSLLRYFGVYFLERANFVAYMKATPMLLSGGILWFSAAAALFCLLLTIRSERIWNQ